MMHPEIIYEDEFVAVVNKPTGLLVHPDGTSKEKTLSDWILETYPETKGVGETLTLKNGEEIERPGVVHRLDRDTSGVMIIAKTQEMFEKLKEQFKEREVQKIYNAFVYGVMKDDEGVIDREIGRSAKDFRKWSAQRGARGTLRNAVTEYTVLQRGEKHTLLEVMPKTGRTHQIRVHLKAINHPVVCDRLYAPKHPCELSFERLALHAKVLRFMHPEKGEVSFEVPLPADFKKAVSEIEG